MRRSAQCRGCVRVVSRNNAHLHKERQRGALIAGFGLVDAAPFREWLEERRRVFLSESRQDANGHVITWREGGPVPPWFSAYVGVADRHLYRILKGEMKRVRIDIVDQALVHEGSTMLWELYPELYPDMEMPEPAGSMGTI